MEGDGRTDGRKLRLGLPPATDQTHARSTRAREVLGRDAAGGSGAQLAELVGLDHGQQRPVLEPEEADDEGELAADDRVALQPGDAELAVGSGHDGEVAAVDGEAPPWHHLDRARGEAAEAVLDHGHDVGRLGEPGDIGFGEIERHDRQCAGSATTAAETGLSRPRPSKG